MADFNTTSVKVLNFDRGALIGDIILITYIYRMVTVIKKNTPKKNVTKLLQEALKTKGVNTHKYCGIISLKETPLKIQRKLRDEWK